MSDDDRSLDIRPRDGLISGRGAVLSRGLAGPRSCQSRGENQVRMRFRAIAALALVALVAAAIALVAGSIKSSPSARSGGEQRGLAFVKRNVDVFSKKSSGESP